MKRFTVIALALGFFGVVGLSQAPQVDAGGEACARTKFETELVKKACADGGLKGAKDAMKVFLKAAKKASSEVTGCDSCHTKLKDGYPLKPNGLELFKAAGGK
jgi:cytochrome c553